MLIGRNKLHTMKEKNKFQIHNKRDSDIITKILKLYPEISKFRINGLCQPTFSPQVASSLSSLFDQIKPLINQIRPPFNKTQENLEKINDLIPNLDSLISQNYLQCTITSFQAKINEAYTSIQDLIKNYPQSQSTFESLMSFMKTIVFQSYSMSSPRLPRTFYENMNSSLEELQGLIEGLPQTDQQPFPFDLLTHFTNIIKESSESLKHLSSSHCLIRATYSFISLFVKLRNRSAISDQIESHAIISKPKKPILSIETSNEVTNSIPIPQLLNDFKSDPEHQNKIDDYVTLFNSILSNEYKFSPPLGIFQCLLHNLSNESLDQSLFVSLLKLLRQYYQLPKQANNMNDITHFAMQLSEFDQILQTTLQSAGADLLQMEQFIKTICDLLLYFNHIKSAVENADEINSTLEVQSVYVDLSEIHLNKPDLIFSLHNIPKFDFVTSLRSRNIIANDITSLKKLNIDLNPNSQAIEELLAASLASQLLDLRTQLRQLEKNITQHHLTLAGDFHTNTFLSFFDQLYSQLEQFYLFANQIPLAALNFKVKILILYSQSFSPENNSIAENILNICSIFYDVYSVYAKLDAVGLLPISVPIHLSYILTTCELLSDKEGIDFFKTVNLFKANPDEISEACQHLKSRLHKMISQSILDDSLFNEILQATHSLAEVAEDLQNLNPNDYVTQSILSLSKWSKTRDIIEIAGIQNRTLVLLEQLNKNSDKYEGKLDIQLISKICDLFTSLRDTLEREKCIKGLLDFFDLSRVAVDDSKDDNEINILQEIYFDDYTDEIQSPQEDPSIQILSGSDEEDILSDDETDEQEEPPNYEIKKFFSNEDDSKTEFFTNRKARAIWFKKDTLSLFMPTPDVPLKSSFNSNLVGIHFYELIKTYMETSKLETEYIQAVHAIFDTMLTVSKSDIISMEDCPSFFKSNSKLYDDFVTISNAQIAYEFDLTIRTLTDLIPKRGKSDSSISAKKVSKVNEIIKQLGQIRSALSMKNFAWFDDLNKCYQKAEDTLKEDVSVNETKIIETFRRLFQLVYFAFMIGRCFIAHQTGDVHCEAEMSIIKLSVNSINPQFLMKDQLSEIMLHQIRSSVHNDIQNLKIIKSFGRILDLPSILDKLETTFYDFPYIFSKLNISLFDLSMFINSALFSSANFTNSSLFNAELFELSLDNYQQTLLAIETFKKEVKNPPIQMNIANLKLVRHAYQQLSKIRTLYSAFDTMMQYVESTPMQQIKGLDILKLRVLILALKSRIFKLINFFPEQFSLIAESFLHYMSFFDEIPQKLGPCATDKPFVRAFIDGWSGFCSSIQPIDSSEVYSEFSDSLRIIISTLSPSGHKDINDLNTIAELFYVSQDTSLLFKLRLAFLFVQKKLPVYTEVYNESDLPFARIFEILDCINLHQGFVTLVKSIITHFNEFIVMNNSYPIECPNLTIDIPSEPEHFDYGNEKQILSHQLPFSEQKQIAESIQTYSKANKSDMERLTNLPIELTRLHKMRQFANSDAHQLNQLKQAKNKMTEVIDEITKESNPAEKENKEDKKILDDSSKLNSLGKYLRLRYDATSIRANEESLANQYREKAKYNQMVNTENIELGDKYNKQANEYRQLTKKAQIQFYSNLIELTTNSKPVISKTIEAIRFPDEDQSQNKMSASTANPLTTELLTLRKDLNKIRDTKVNNIPTEEKIEQLKEVRDIVKGGNIDL